MDPFELSVPTFVMLPDKKVWINLNTYRNMHYIVNNKCKVAFYKAFKPELKRWKQHFSHLLDYDKTMFKMKLNYKITAADQRKFDVSNVLSIIDKFAADCLVKEGLLIDDNWQYLDGFDGSFGGVTGERTCSLRITIV